MNDNNKINDDKRINIPHVCFSKGRLCQLVRARLAWQISRSGKQQRFDSGLGFEILHDDLIEYCERFRSLIVACDPETLFVTLQGFPGGACEDASLLLARYLGENGFGEFRHMAGKRGDRSHVWLQQGNVILDITADQFSDFPHGPVYVGTDGDWYQAFAGHDSGPADYSKYGDYIEAMLSASYANIMGQ